jgi:hypothetical protein
MKKFVIPIALALGLVSCNSVEDRIEQRLKIQSQLPEGCNFRFYGFYGDVPVVAIVCGDNDEGRTNSITMIGPKGSRITADMSGQ